MPGTEHFVHLLDAKNKNWEPHRICLGPDAVRDSSGKTLIQYADIDTIILGKETDALLNDQYASRNSNKFFFSIKKLDGKTADIGAMDAEQRQKIVLDLMDSIGPSNNAGLVTAKRQIQKLGEEETFSIGMKGTQTSLKELLSMAEKMKNLSKSPMPPLQKEEVFDCCGPKIDVKIGESPSSKSECCIQRGTISNSDKLARFKQLDKMSRRFEELKRKRELQKICLEQQRLKPQPKAANNYNLPPVAKTLPPPWVSAKQLQSARHPQRNIGEPKQSQPKIQGEYANISASNGITSPESRQQPHPHPQSPLMMSQKKQEYKRSMIEGMNHWLDEKQRMKMQNLQDSGPMAVRPQLSVIQKEYDAAMDQIQDDTSQMMNLINDNQSSQQNVIAQNMQNSNMVSEARTKPWYELSGMPETQSVQYAAHPAEWNISGTQNPLTASTQSAGSADHYYTSNSRPIKYPMQVNKSVEGVVSLPDTAALMNQSVWTGVKSAIDDKIW